MTDKGGYRPGSGMNTPPPPPPEFPDGEGTAGFPPLLNRVPG